MAIDPDQTSEGWRGTRVRPSAEGRPGSDANGTGAANLALERCDPRGTEPRRQVAPDPASNHLKTQGGWHAHGLDTSVVGDDAALSATVESISEPDTRLSRVPKSGLGTITKSVGAKCVTFALREGAVRDRQSRTRGR